jgi:hypothetical protein
MVESPRAMAQRMLLGVGTLEQRLREIQGTYKTAPSWPDFDRDFQDLFAAHQSVAAVVDFIDSVPAWKRDDLGFAFVRLLVALKNIHEGRTETWLTPQRSGAVAVAKERQMFRGRCAGVVEMLFDAGHPIEGAAGLVFTLLGGPATHWLTGRGNQSDLGWRTIARWRDNVTGTADASHALDGYQSMMRLIAERRLNASPPEAEANAKRIIRGIRISIARLGGPPAEP